MEEKAHLQGRGRIILGSKSGIYQYQTAAGLNQQTVDDGVQMDKGSFESSAIQMVNDH
jgi:hypothetical protein